MPRRTAVVTVSMEDEDLACLDELADKLGVRRSEAVRDAVQWLNVLESTGILLRARRLSRMVGEPAPETMEPTLRQFIKAIDSNG